MQSLLRQVYIKFLPNFAKQFARSAYLSCAANVYRMRHRGDACQCNFCGFTASQFLPSGYNEGILVEKQVIGGGARPNARCPKCYSLDRERQIAAVLKNLGLNQDSVVLHVAPEKNLNDLVRTELTQKVHECDLSPEYYAWAPNIEQQDLTQLTYDERSFDLVLCNHVFEHIPNDIVALRELLRVLKPGRFAILQVPYSESISDTEEDLENLDPEYQLQRFGQRTHVRIYQKDDYIRRAESVGFLNRFVSADELDSRFAFDEREGIFLFQKPE